jgi:oligopeptide/dipeptide ABC transporter ATP-binding protein
MGVLDANQDWAGPIHSTGSNLFTVSDLNVSYRLDRERESNVLKQVGFTIAKAEIVGLLGESGCGKTTTALSLIQMLPAAARIAAGSMHLNGHDLLALDEARLREIRGSEISIIHQDSDVLNPVMRVGNQVMEVLRAHRSGKAAQMQDEICALFLALGLSDCDRVYRSFPHQLSGGQRRRVAIAQALICKPPLIIADEPTAWLDSETTAEALSVFHDLRQRYGTAFLLISHDPKVLMVVDRVLVMYAGEIIESGTRQQILERPKHPYTKALLQCSAQGNAGEDVVTPHMLPYIPGRAPDPSEVLSGCAFSARCSQRMELCDLRRPQLYADSLRHSVRCFQYETTG